MALPEFVTKRINIKLSKPFEKSYVCNIVHFGKILMPLLKPRLTTNLKNIKRRHSSSRIQRFHEI